MLFDRLIILLNARKYRSENNLIPASDLIFIRD